MDRVIVYDQALAQTTDVLQTSKFAMIGLAYAMRAALGTNAVVNGLACTQTTPTASLQVNVGVGSIYAVDETDMTAYGDLGTDTSSVVKQGILIAPVTLTITPPPTPGYSQVFLIEAILSDNDGGSAVLPYNNAANPAQPLSGPNNSGSSQYTLRQVKCTIALKAGVSAPTGSQVAPTPDVGFVGLYTITVPNGLTQVTNSIIVQLPTAPFFPTLPAVPGDVQTNLWTYAQDTGSVNAFAATLYPPVTALVPGLVGLIKIANTNTGPATLNLNNLGAVPVHRATGAALSSGDLTAGAVVAFMYDGTAFQVLNFTGATSGTVNNNFNSFAIPYGPDTGSVNAMTAVFSPAVASLVAGMALLVKAANTNTGATTLTPSGLSATAIQENGVALLPAAITAGEVVLLVYDGTNLQKINARNRIFNFDESSPPASPLNMQVGDHLTVTFTGATAIPLHVASVPGVYEVEFNLTSSSSLNTDILFLPNDATYSAGAFPEWMIQNDDGGVPNPPYLKATPSAFYDQLSGASFNAFTIDMFEGPDPTLGVDNINDRGPCILRVTLSTFTAAKMLRWLGGITGGPSMGYSKWTDTTTLWTSLGTLQVCANGTNNPGFATVSGVAIVRRLA